MKTILILGGAALAYYLYTKNKASAASADTTQSAAAKTATSSSKVEIPVELTPLITPEQKEAAEMVYKIQEHAALATVNTQPANLKQPGTPAGNKIAPTLCTLKKTTVPTVTKASLLVKPKTQLGATWLTTN